MFGHLGLDRDKKDAYTLAEMLVVMAIIALIFLALPPATKKLFKIGETRKAHGRFECYWKDVNGTKTLYQHFVGENGSESEKKAKVSTGDNAYCEFTPPNNVIYFMLYAVGGGGAGAAIEDNTDASLTDNPSANSRRALDPKELVYKRTSFAANKSDDQLPAWVAYIKKFYKSNGNPYLPWMSKEPSNPNAEGCKTYVAAANQDDPGSCHGFDNAPGVLSYQKVKEYSIGEDHIRTEKDVYKGSYQYTQYFKTDTYECELNNASSAENIPCMNYCLEYNYDKCGVKYGYDVGNNIDVGRGASQQNIRYRLSGNKGKIVSSFIPALPTGVTLKIAPGQGGKVATTDSSKVVADTDGNYPLN